MPCQVFSSNALKLPSSAQWQSWIPPTLGWMMGLSAIVLLVCSSVRHLLFQSTALDLGYFDQAVYLISQGQVPIVSFWGYHVMGGHADWILYGVAGLYKLYPTIYWLFGIQAIALSLGALPSWHLARQAGLSEGQARAIALAYLLYPVIFNLNLFDFHPEVIALPLFLAAVLAVRADRLGWFVLCLGLILGCRDALSLTVAAMGVWLLLWERKYWAGAIALGLGLAWFGFVTQWLIPQFRPAGVESVARYSYLGGSLREILQNLVLRPDLLLGKVFSRETLGYLGLLVAPVLWGLAPRQLAAMVVTIPTLGMNILSDLSLQRDLLHQYSLPAIPFLILSAIAGVAAGQTLLRRPRWIMLWSLVSFVALAKFGFFGARYLSRLDSWSAFRSAIAQISAQTSVLTNSYLVPHLTHRPQIEYTRWMKPPESLAQYEYILLSRRHPGWGSTPEFTQQILDQAAHDRCFQLLSEQDEVYLFSRKYCP